MLETKTGVFFIAGLGFFALAFLSNALVPILMYRHLPEQTVEQLLEKNGNLRYQFEDLARRFPDSFTAAYGQPPEDAAEREKWLDELTRMPCGCGRKIYVGEGCWHCHSQFVRPVSNEDRRWGPVSKTEEYQNELQRPVMFGTRRVGPDLSREGGRRSNDWHAVHFFRPTDSVGRLADARVSLVLRRLSRQAQRTGLALMTYVQWLGLVAGELSLLRRLPAVGRSRASRPRRKGPK